MAFEAKYAVERPNLVIGFLALFSFVAAAALRAAWRGTFHNLFQLLAHLLNVSIVGRHPFGFLADALARADNNVYAWLGHLKDASGHAFVTLCLWVAMQVTMVVVALAALSYELLRWAHVIGHRTSVTVVKKTVNVITKPLAHQAAKGAVAHDSRVPALEREIATLRERIAAQDAAIAKVQAITLPAPATLPQRRPAPITKPITKPAADTIPKVGDHETAIQGIKKRLGQLGKLLTVGGLIGLVAGSVARLGGGWTRCSKTGRWGRNLCGMDESLLQSLIADTLLIVGTVSLVEFARGMQSVTGEIAPQVEKFWRAG